MDFWLWISNKKFDLALLSVFQFDWFSIIVYVEPLQSGKKIEFET